MAFCIGKFNTDHTFVSFFKFMEVPTSWFWYFLCWCSLMIQMDQRSFIFSWKREWFLRAWSVWIYAMNCHWRLAYYVIIVDLEVLSFVWMYAPTYQSRTRYLHSVRTITKNMRPVKITNSKISAESNVWTYNFTWKPPWSRE